MAFIEFHQFLMYLNTDQETAPVLQVAAQKQKQAQKEQAQAEDGEETLKTLPLSPAQLTTGSSGGGGGGGGVGVVHIGLNSMSMTDVSASVSVTEEEQPKSLTLLKRIPISAKIPQSTLNSIEERGHLASPWMNRFYHICCKFVGFDAIYQLNLPYWLDAEVTRLMIQLEATTGLEPRQVHNVDHLVRKCDTIAFAILGETISLLKDSYVRFRNDRLPGFFCPYYGQSLDFYNTQFD